MGNTIALTHGLTGSLTAGLDDGFFPFGTLLTLEQQVAAMLPDLWLDATETYAKSKIAVSLDGTNDEMTSDLVLATSDIDDPFTISGWFAPQAGVTNGWVTKGVFDTGIFVYQSSNIVYFGVVVGALKIRVNAIIPAYTMGHWTFTYDGGLEVAGLAIYHNDEALSLTLQNSDTLSGTMINSNPFVIGDIRNLASYRYQGDIDQVHIYDKALSTPEITALYNSNAGLNYRDLDGTETFYSNIVAWYDMNVPNRFGKNYTEDNHAVNLDNSSNVNLGGSNEFDFEYTDAFSAFAWVKINTLGPSNTIMSERAVTTQRGWSMSWWTNDNLRVYLCSTVSVNFIEIFSPTSGLVADTWYHIGFSYNGNGLVSGVKMYIDDAEVSVSSSTDSLDSNTIAGGGPFYVGTGDGTMDGVLSNSCVYDAVIDPTDSTGIGLYNSGSPIDYSSLSAGQLTNLQAHWSFNSSNKTDLGNDNTSNSHNLTTGAGFDSTNYVGGVGSLDLTEVSITGVGNVTPGHVEGNASGYDGCTRWTERGTSGNDAVQATLAQVPTFFSDQYVRYTGNDNLDTGSNVDLSGDFTIVMRCRHSDVTESCDLLATSATVLNNSVAGKSVCLGTTATNALVNDTWTDVALKYTGGSIYFFKDGVANGNGVATNTFTTATLNIGDVTQTQNFDIRGMVVAESALSDANIATIGEYFATLDPA